MLPLCVALPAFVLPAQYMPATTRPRATIKVFAHLDGELPQMYRARWSSDTESSEDNDAPSSSDIAAQIGGAMLGATAIASVGAFKSAAETPSVLAVVQNTWGYGGTDDVAVYLDAITGWVANCNAILAPSFGAFIFYLAVAIDIAALISMVAILMIAIQEDRLAAPSVTNELVCLANTSIDEPVCGAASFDSTDGYACVETWVNGRFVWQCA